MAFKVMFVCVSESSECCIKMPKSKHLVTVKDEDSSILLHRSHERKRKVENVVDNEDSHVGNFDTDMSTKTKSSKTQQQTEDTPLHSLDDGSGTKEKNVSTSISHKLHKKMRRKNNGRTSESETQSTAKLVSTYNNTDENAQSSVLNTSCQENPGVDVNRTSKKKQKRLQDESVHEKNELAVRQSAKGEISVDSVKKTKKVHPAKSRTASVNSEGVDSVVASSSQYRALEYLRTWKFAHDSWTFQKVRQVWLLQHMYDTTKVKDMSYY